MDKSDKQKEIVQKIWTDQQIDYKSSTIVNTFGANALAVILLHSSGVHIHKRICIPRKCKNRRFRTKPNSDVNLATIIHR